MEAGADDVVPAEGEEGTVEGYKVCVHHQMSDMMSVTYSLHIQRSLLCPHG